MKSEAPDWLFENIKYLSESCQKQYLLFITILTYFIITILSSTDSDLILNGQLSLPVLNIQVPVNFFCLISPLIIILLYSYLNFSLLLLFEQLDRLQSDFSNKLKRDVPILLSGANKNGTFKNSQNFIFIFSYYFLLPLAIILSSGWFLRKHDPYLSYIISLYPLLCLITILFFIFRLNKLSVFKINRFFLTLLISIVCIYEVFTLSFVIPAANSGRLYQNERHYPLQSLLIALTRVDLSQNILVKEKKKEYETFWVNLADAHLEGADLSYSILKQAYMQNAHLNGCALFHTTFRGAVLDGSDFQFAKIESTDFSYAKMNNLKNLDSLSLCKARTFYHAQLDKNVLDYINKHCPLLLSEKSQNW